MRPGPLFLLKQTFADWSEDRATRLSAALAYYALFSIAPLLLIAIAVAGLVFGQEAAQGQVFAQLRGLVGDEGAAALQEITQNARRTDSGIAAGLIGLGLLLFGASGVMGELKSALNQIWEVPPPKSGGLWAIIRTRFFSFTMVLGVGFLLLVSLVISAVLAAMGAAFEGWLPASEPVMHLVQTVVSLAVITVLFALIFRYVPDVEITWRDVWPGAALTAALFTLGKLAIGLYLGKGTFASSYGAAGSLVVFLVWVYYSAQILFFGAELTQVYARAGGREIVPEAEAKAAVSPSRDRRRGVDRRRMHPVTT
jgi:membrane protein